MTPPYLNPTKQKNVTMLKQMSTSPTAIEREFTFLFSVPITDKQINVYYEKEDKFVRGFDSVPNQEGRYDILFFLKFKNIKFKLPQGLTKVNSRQVSQVYTDKVHRSGQLASDVYFELIKQGVLTALISDNSQYLGGQELWKKLARDSVTRNFKVRIWDILTNQYYSKYYDSTNIVDSEIWTTGLDFTGENKLLVLTL